MTEIRENAVDDRTEIEGKYLTFSLAQEEYGIGILKVREIIGLMPITPVPKAPAEINGVINLRGRVIPVLNLRQKFDLPHTEKTQRTCIIVVELAQDGKEWQMGVMVDSVSEVLNINACDIENAPSFGIDTDHTSYIIGMAKTGGDVKILMDIDKVIGNQETALMAA